jgi:hypothetical protein
MDLDAELKAAVEAADEALKKAGEAALAKAPSDADLAAVLSADARERVLREAEGAQARSDREKQQERIAEARDRNCRILQRWEHRRFEALDALQMHSAALVSAIKTYLDASAGSRETLKALREDVPPALSPMHERTVLGELISSALCGLNFPGRRLGALNWGAAVRSTTGWKEVARLERIQPRRRNRMAAPASKNDKPTEVPEEGGVEVDPKLVVPDTAGQVTRHFVVHMPEGATGDDLRNPAIWRKVQGNRHAALQKMDHLMVLGSAEDWYARCVVTYATRDSCQLLIEKVGSFSDKGKQSFFSDGTYEVAFGDGVYYVRRLADGVRMTPYGFDSEEQARQALFALYPKVA